MASSSQARGSDTGPNIIRSRVVNFDRSAAEAGSVLGPLQAVQVGMGENILILAFVVIVIGGIGSIRGALIGAILVGCIDTLGRTLMQQLFREFLPPQWASAAGPADA